MSSERMKWLPSNHTTWILHNQRYLARRVNNLNIEPLVDYSERDREMGKTHNSHNCTLIILAKTDYELATCNICGKECSGMTYGCKEHKFFVDISCLNLDPPSELWHPSHHEPNHFLTLRNAKDSPSMCHLCYRRIEVGSMYACKLCDYVLDFNCTFPSFITIKSHDHRHELNYFKECRNTDQNCDCCKEPCRNYSFFCLYINCSFCIHLQCGPLPRTIPYWYCYCYLNQLTLIPSVKLYHYDNVNEDESEDEMYQCDVCYDDLKAGTPAYGCQGCNTVAHIKCVTDEVLRSYEVKSGLVTLRRSKEKGDSLFLEEVEIEDMDTSTVKEIMDSFSENDKRELDIVRKKRVAETIKELAYCNSKSSTLSRSGSPFLSDAFKEFMRKLNLGIQLSDPLNLYKDNDVLVNVGDNKVTEHLAPILEEVFANYGDISAQSKLGSKMKTYVFVVLCGTLDSMINTKVVDVSESLLYRWWNNFIFIHNSGFDIEFAIESLKVIVEARFGPKGDTANSKLDEEIMNLEDGKDKLDRELQGLQDKLNRKKQKRARIPGLPDYESVKKLYSSKAFAWKLENSDISRTFSSHGPDNGEGYAWYLKRMITRLS